MHHMDPSKKNKLNGDMTRGKFRREVQRLKNGLLDDDLKKFKEELDTIIFLPRWFHKYVHSNEFDLSKFNTREEYYDELLRATQKARVSDKFKLKGENVVKWFETLKEIANTFQISSTDRQKIKKLLEEVRAILLSDKEE